MATEEKLMKQKMIHLKQKIINDVNEIKKDPYNLRFANLSLRDDKELILELVQKCGRVIEFASQRLRKDYEVGVIAVKNDGFALAFLGERLKDNFKLVKEGVNQNGLALLYASKRLRNDKEIMLTALKNTGLSLKYSEKYRDDIKYVLMSLKDMCKLDFIDLDKKWFKNKEFMTKAMEKYPNILEFYDRKILTREDILKYIKKNGLNLKYLKDFNNDLEIVKEAVNQNGLALEFAGKNLKNDIEIVSLAVKNNPIAIKFAGEKCKKI